MDGPHAHAEAELAARDPGARQVDQVHIEQAHQARDEQVARAAQARVDRPEGNRQQRQVQRRQRQRDAPHDLRPAAVGVVFHELHGGARLGRALGCGAGLGHRIGARLAFQAQPVFLEVHQAQFRRARLEIVAVAFAQHQEAVAVGLRFAVRAAGGQDAQPFGTGFAREHGAELVAGVERIFGEEHAAAAGGFGELAGRDLGQVGALLEAFVVFADLAIGPRRGHQRQPGHRQRHRNGHAQHGLEPVGQRQAAGEPHHHFGFAVIARDRGQDRDEDGDREHGRQRRDGRQRGQHQHHVGPDVASRGFAEQAHEQHAEPHDEQSGKDNDSVTGDLADDRSFE